MKPARRVIGWIAADGCRHYPAEAVKPALERRLLRRMASE